MSIVFDGSRAVDGTEWCIIANSAGPSTQSTPNAFQVLFDTSALANTDVTFEVRVYEKVLSSSSQIDIITPALIVPGMPSFSIPFSCYHHGYSITIKRISGTTTPTIRWSGRKP